MVLGCRFLAPRQEIIFISFLECSGQTTLQNPPYVGEQMTHALILDRSVAFF